MYKKDELIKKLEMNNFPITIENLNKYLKDWKIDPVYEDENKEEYFDDLTVSKLIQGIILIKQGKNNTEIHHIINNSGKDPDKAKSPLDIPKKNEAQPVINHGELTNFTLDITNQTLMLLAETVASKISFNIQEKVQESEIFESLLEMGKLKRDNEILSEQVSKLVDENKKLIFKINLLQKENNKFKLQQEDAQKFVHLVGSLYLKKE